MKIYLIILVFIFLSSCSTPKVQPLVEKKLPPIKLTDKEPDISLSLLKQGAHYHQLTGDIYLNVCQQFLQIYTDTKSWQAGWILAYSFSDKQSCITHEIRLEILKYLQKTGQLNSNLTWLNQAQIKTLQNIDRLKETINKNTKKIKNQQRAKQLLKQKNKNLTEQIKALTLIEDSIKKRINHDKHLTP